MSKKKREFMALYHPVHEQFERFCKARVYGAMDFQDLMHDTILMAFERFEAIEKKESFLSFLFGSSLKILANANRKNREQFWSDGEVANTANTDRTDKQLDVDDLYKGIAELSDILGEALILFEISGFSIKEIAKIQNASDAAVKQRLSRARQELMRIMQDEPAVLRKTS
jgi:RNA polymerase sigma factor (sigma-70 family)